MAPRRVVRFRDRRPNPRGFVKVAGTEGASHLRTRARQADAWEPRLRLDVAVPEPTVLLSVCVLRNESELERVLSRSGALKPRLLFAQRLGRLNREAAARRAECGEQANGEHDGGHGG